MTDEMTKRDELAERMLDVWEHHNHNANGIQTMKVVLQVAIDEHEKEVQRLQEQIAELEGTLPGRIKGAQALADERCRCFLMRAEAAEARLAVYSSGGFADADALAATYLDISAERDALRDQIRVLREALNLIACWNDANANVRLALSGSFTRFDEPYSVEIAHKALAATEPRQ